MIGKKLADRYEIVSEVGRGGMGVVYRARDPRLNRDVALKVIPPTQLSEESETRFQREAQLVAQMDHPSIVPIYDFGRHEDALYFVMALVQGTNLRAFLREGPALDDVVAVGIQVAEALEYSHARGVVHRDIKPENIMVAREEGFGVRVRVMDFGLARATAGSRLTRTGTFMGTLAYLSPEQIVASDLDGRSDIYALGTVLYECLVGEPPFTGEPQAVVYRIAHEFPQAPRARGAAIDEALEGIILGCLAKDRSQRPQRAGEVAEALKRYRLGLRDTDRARPVADFTRTLQVARPAFAPFVGRQRETAELQQRLNAAIAGECQFVVIGGEAGIGKTRLLDELENLAKARQIRVLHGRAVEQDRALPYQGFYELIVDYFRLKDQGSAPPPDFSDLAEDLVALFPMLAEVPEIRSMLSGGTSVEQRSAGGAESRTQIFELLARTLTRIAAGRPLVLSLEDLHSAEVSLEALAYIVRRLGPAPILIVGTYRSTEIHARHPLSKVLEDFHGERRCVAMVLGPLSPSEHRAFLETLVEPRIADGLVKRLYEGTEGNPFFTRELVRSLIDAGGIVKDDSGAWNLSAEAGLAADALPATIQKAVEQRVGRLPDELRDILAAASVIGKSFDARDLAALVQARDVDDAIDKLVEQGLIEEERESRGEMLSFSSGVVRDVLYGALSPRKRRSLHRRCAELIESRHAGRLERVLPQLVTHFFQGDVPEKTVEYAVRLTRTALEAFSVEEAVRSATTALTFLDDEWEGPRVVEGEARLLLARARRMSGDTESALREASAAERIFEQEGERGRAVEALLLAAETAWQARQPIETGRWVEKGLAAAHESDDPGSLRQLLSLAATLANLSGEYDRANAYLEQAAQLGSEARGREADEAVPSGGGLVVAQANPVSAIEPASTKIIEESEIAASIYETLLATDAAGRLTTALCEKWEMTDAGSTCVLTLRSDVRFSDGTPLTAAGVKQSFETSIRLAAATLPPAFTAVRGVAEFAAGKASEVSGLVVRGDGEVAIHLLESLPIYPSLLTEGSTAVVRPVDAGSQGRPRLLGTGPFVLVSQEPERVVLDRNPAYWRSGLPRLDRIEFRPGLSAESMARRFRAGEVDLARDLLPEDLEETLRDPRFRQGLVETPKKNTYFVLFNCHSGPQARHEALRRAIAGVVRTRDLVWRTLGRFAEPATSLIPPGMIGHDPGGRRHALGRDEAVAMLRDAGLDGTVRLNAAVQPILRERAGALLTSLFETWSDLGVEVTAAPLDMPGYLACWDDNAALDLLIGRWNADYNDPDNFTHSLFHSRMGELCRYFSSPEADRVLEEARSETRPAVREALYRKFETMVTDTGALVPLFHDIDYRLASSRVRGLVLRGTAPYVNYGEVGVAEAKPSTPEPRRAAGGVVQIPLAGVVTSLDPAQRSTAETSDILPAIFETLTRDTGDARIVPWLASEMRVEDGGRRYRFRLRDDVTFSDGRRLGARDVRYSLERLLQSPDSSDRLIYSSIRGARALIEGSAKELTGFKIHSAVELSIELEQPVAFFPALLSHDVAAVVPEGSDPSGANHAAACVGTGPFRVAAFEPGQRLVLERNRTYWRRGYPRSEGVTFSFGVAPGDILAGFRQGRFSIASDLYPADVDELRREPEFASGYREAPRLVTYFVAFNMRRGPLADLALRRRLVQATDVPRLVRQHIGRLAIPAHSLIPPGLLGYDPAATSQPDRFAPPAAASPGPGVDLTAAVNPVFLGRYAALAREVWLAFGTQGVTIRPVTSTMEEFYDATMEASTDLVIGRWNADYPDADTFAYMQHSEGGFHGRLCQSPEMDRLIERARAEPAPAARHALYREVEEIIARDAMLLPLFHEQAYRFARPEVEGMSVALGSPTVPLEVLRIRS